jgi:hypothetical protein
VESRYLLSGCGGFGVSSSGLLSTTLPHDFSGSDARHTDQRIGTVDDP